MDSVLENSDIIKRFPGKQTKFIFRLIDNFITKELENKKKKNIPYILTLLEDVKCVIIAWEYSVFLFCLKSWLVSLTRVKKQWCGNMLDQ